MPPAAAYADLHLLTVLARTRSYTGAAQALGLAKSSVSERIAELERQAGLPLVRRTTRHVELTPAGRQLVEQTRDAFERIANSFAQVRDLAGHPRGLVRVTAPVALGRQVLAPMLPAFLHAHPEVRIDLALEDRLSNLAHDGFDLAIRHTDAPPETHVAWPLRATRTVLVAHADYLRRHGLPAHPSDLAAHACAVYLRGDAPARWLFEPVDRREGGRVQVEVQGALRANNSEVLREAALQGLAVALLPDFTVAEHLAAQRLVPLLQAWRPLGTFGEGIYALRPWSAHVPRAVRCLVDHLRHCFAAGQGDPAAAALTPSASKNPRRKQARPASVA